MMVKGFDVVDLAAPAHEALLKESPMYAYAFENKLAGLTAHLLAKYLERRAQESAR